MLGALLNLTYLGAFASPSIERKSKSTGDLSYPQIYQVKEKDLPKLHQAAWKGNLVKVIELCRPDKLNTVDKDGRSPLHLAVAANNLDVTLHLLNEGAKMQILDRDSRSPLIIASQKGNPKMMELLLSHLNQKNLINMPDKNGLNALFYALKNENILLLKVLLKEKTLDLDFKDRVKNTALHNSVIQKKFEAIELLIEHGADIDGQNADGRTPLMLASHAGDQELVDFLLDYGADTKILDKSGNSAINFAEQSRNSNCVKLLKEPRPVKKNLTNMPRLKRSMSSNDHSEGASGAATLASDNNKKFEKMFQGKKGSQSENLSQRDTRASKYVDHQNNEDTSEMLTEKSGLNNNKKSETWSDDSDEDTQNSMSYSQNIRSKVNNKLANSNEFGKMLNKLGINKDDEDINIDIDINPNNKHWVFSSQNEEPEHVLDALFVGNEAKPDPTNWTVFVHTSDIKDAGTDSNVYIQIFGNKAASSQFYLEDTKGNPFERGKVDIFHKNLPDIGRPKKIKIGHNNKGAFSGWHLEKVILQNNITNEKFLFPCNRWLAKDELDHKLELEIDVQKNESGGTGEFTANKLRESWNSVSSWNSSEEEDMSSGSNKKLTNQTIPKPNILNQIDEETSRLNETGLSRNSTQNESMNQKRKQAAPEISDVEESFVEDVDLSNSNVQHNESQNSPLAYLVKNNIPKRQNSNETIGNLVIKKSNDRTNDTGTRSDIGLTDIWREASVQNNKKGNNNNINNNNTSKNNFSFESISLEVDEVLKSPVFSPKKMFNTSSSGKSDSNLTSNAKQQPFKTRETFAGFSDNDDVSQSIGDLQHEFDQIKNKENDRSKLVHESSVDFLIKNNLVSGLNNNNNIKNEKEPEGLSQLFASLTKKESIKKQNSTDSFGSIAKLSNQHKNEEVDADSFDKSESLDNLEDMFNDAKKKSPVRPAKEHIENIKNFGNDLTNEAFILHSPRPQNNTTIGKLVGNLIQSNEKNSELNSSDSLVTSKNQAIGQMISSIMSNNNNNNTNINNTTTTTTTTNNNDKIKNFEQPKNQFKYDSFDSSSDSDEELSNGKLNGTGGSIGAAVGAVIVSGINSTTTPISSPINRNTTSTFANILPELFEKPSSPRKQFDDYHLTKNNDYTNELAEKLRDKNNTLEKKILELETKLRDTEIQKKNFEMAFNNSDRLLAEKERYISNMNTEKIKSELANKNDLNDIKTLRKEISDLREDKHALENKLSILQTTAAITASHGQGSNAGSLRSSEDFSQNHQQYESLTIKIKALENQIEELNKDRKILSSCKEDLSIKLDETENEIKKRNEALEIATIKFNMEKKVLNDENLRFKKDLNELNETRKNLQFEIDTLKLQLNDKNLTIDKLNAEKSNYEQRFDREKDENGKLRKSSDIELSMLKEQQSGLIKKLEDAEIKLMTAEKEVKHTKSQIELREKQIIDLKDQLSRVKSEFDINMNLYQKEKEEKERLLQKCETLESNIRKHLKEIHDLKQNQNDNNKHTNVNITSLPPSGPSDNNSYSNEFYKINAIEKENIKLHDDLKRLIEKLQKTESELEKYKINAEIEKLNNTTNSQRNEDNQFFSNDNEKLKMEVQKLRNDFNLMLTKYSNLESNNMELNTSFNTLKNQSLNNKDYEIIKPKEQIDIPTLITESQSLNKIAALNNYLIKNIIDPNDSLPDLNQSNLYKGYRNEPENRNLANYSSFFSSPSDSFLSLKPQVCKKCSTSQNNPYLDLLKYELSKRIELQVAKEMPLASNYDHSNRNLNGTVDRLMTDLNYNLKNKTSNYDSLYNSLNYPQNSRLSNMSNTDLLNSLRSKFLI